MGKRMRLPNGFGSITELSNKRLRNRFRVMITIGKTNEGRPIQKILKPQGYFKTYNEAYMALMEYHKDPYSLEESITVKELYEKWSKEYFAKLKSNTSIRTVTAAWSYCSQIYNMPVKDVRTRHIKGCIDNGFVEYQGSKKYASANTKTRIKSIFNLMFDYAMEYELIDKNYARNFKISDSIIREKEQNHKGHIPFEDNEIEILWKNLEKYKYIDTILIQCYMGWRPQELFNIEISNIDFDNMTIRGGMKTKAGTNRLVPIPKKIIGIVKNSYQEALELNSKYLINCPDSDSGIRMNYDKYKNRYRSIIKQLKLNPEHKPHDCRMHFITQAKKYNLDEYAIKYIVGHSITDITEKVYTKRDIEWLHSEINKIS